MLGCNVIDDAERDRKCPVGTGPVCLYRQCWPRCVQNRNRPSSCTTEDKREAWSGQLASPIRRTIGPVRMHIG